MHFVIATVQDLQAKVLTLIDLARRGEEVLITQEGETVARLTGVPLPKAAPDRRAWLQRLATLRARLATGVAGASVQQILDEDRGE